MSNDPNIKHCARCIENHSGFMLINFRGIKGYASRKKMIEALQRDKNWLEDHHTEVCKRIDRLCRQIWPDAP